MDKCSITYNIGDIIRYCPNRGIWKHQRYKGLFCDVHKECFKLMVPGRWEKVNEDTGQSK